MEWYSSWCYPRISIGLLIENKDWVNWEQKMSVAPIKKIKITLPRPGHADLAGLQKFGFDDIEMF